MKPCRLGDPHNFNQYVELVSSSIGFRVKKPRTVFWEKTFLDSQSKFRLLLKNLRGGEGSNYLGDISYGLDNSAAYVAEDAFSSAISNNLLVHYGQLLAFVTVFGICDLHTENVIYKTDYLQILDIECILFYAESPLDSLLLPNHSSKNNTKAIHWLFDGVSLHQYATILNSMHSEFIFLKSNANKILHFFSNELQELKTHPIRILLRSSNEYTKSFDKLELKFPFIESERVQMSRNDIPYFFGFFGEKFVRWYDSVGHNEVVPLEHLQPCLQKIERSFRSFEELLSEERIDRVHKQSLIVSLSKMNFNEESFDRVFNELRIYKSDSIIGIESSQFNIQSKLLRG